jgi:hypothetical protein
VLHKLWHKGKKSKFQNQITEKVIKLSVTYSYNNSRCVQFVRTSQTKTDLRIPREFFKNNLF